MRQYLRLYRYSAGESSTSPFFYSMAIMSYGSAGLLNDTYRALINNPDRDISLVAVHSVQVGVRSYVREHGYNKGRWH